MRDSRKQETGLEAKLSTTNSFNPLDSAADLTDEHFRRENQRRTISNIIDSYHGNYDVFAELLQNAVDAVHARYLDEGEPYEPKIWIEIDQISNSVTVCDNGTGIAVDQFESVLAPNVSFKDSRSTGKRPFRGHKGVGLSFLAYGFNYLRISTTTGDFSRTGTIEHGRDWANGARDTIPLVVDTEDVSEFFSDLSRGTAVTVGFGPATRPKSLSHLATSALEWSRILRSQTALGQVHADDLTALPLQAEVRVRRQQEGIGTVHVDARFLFPHLMNLSSEEDAGNKYLDLGEFYRANPNSHAVSTKYRRNHGIYKFWTGTERADPALGLAADDIRWLDENGVWFYGFMAYSTDFWKENQADDKKVTSAKVVQPGLVFASEQMLIGDYQEISLNRYTGRQKQVTVVVHVDALRPDLGRKSFEEEVVLHGQAIARRVVEWFSKDDRNKTFLRAATDKKAAKSVTLEDWKFEARQWLDQAPLSWKGTKIPLRSEPRQEQDVVILFSQLISLGILPGFEVLGAAEGNQQYDSLMRVDYEHQGGQLFGSEHPWALHPETFKANSKTLSPLLVAEFKLHLASLVRDINDDTKVFGDIDLAIAWSAGAFQQGGLGDFELHSVLKKDSVVDRIWPGVTHRLIRSGSDHTIHVILLEDLFLAANNWSASNDYQVRNYL